MAEMKPEEQKPLVNQIPGLTPLQQPMVNAQAPTGGPGDATPTNVPTLPPPPVPAPTSSAPAGVPTSTVSSGNNLLSTQINPSAPTATAPNTNFGTGAVTAQPSPQSDSQFQKYTQGFDQSLSSLTNGPNRTELALQKLRDFDTETAPQFDAGIRKIGQAAAKFGRLGSGMTTNDLTGLSATNERNRMLLKNDLARSVAEGDINDRFRLADVYSNARSQQYGFGSTDRGYNTGVDQYNQGALFDRQRAANDYTSQYNDTLFNQNRSNANDLRGERDYQTGRSDKALADEIQRKVLEDSLLNSAFGRAQSRFSAGEAGNPASAYSDYAGQLGSDAGSLMGAGAGLLSTPKTQGIDMATLKQLLGI